MLDFGFYCMDCMEGMAQFPDNYFELGVVDPEYGRKEHGGKNRSKYVLQKNGARIFVPSGDYENRDWDNRPPSQAYFDELKRVSRNQIIWGCNYFDYSFGPGRIIWDKCNDGSDQSDAEIAYNSLTDRVDIFRYMWRGMFQGRSISEGWIQQGNKALNEKHIHPTQKPVALYDWLLSKYAKPGDKILDTHVGSASSLISCHKNGFYYVGFEKDPYYFKLANKRIESYKSQITLWDCGMERK